MTQHSDALNKLGELFVIGMEGKTLSDDTSAFLAQAGIGGVIYFSHNYENPEQIAKLSNEIQENRGSDLPLWIAVDQEGGRVQRFKEGFTRLPSGGEICAGASPKLAFDIAQVAAKELAAVGINLNFAPVADILTNPKNPAIGDRAFGSDEETVTKFVTAVVRGHVTQNVQPCVKHFPGHGDTSVDSHEDLPRITTSLSQLMEREIRPFVKTFKSRCNMVMIGHLLVESVDPKFPATLSKKWLQEILRKELRYSRIIVSDDMEMKAVTKLFGDKESAILALDAGCDLLVYRSEGAARKAYAACAKALEEGRLNPDLIISSADRLQTLKQELFHPYQPVNISEVKQKVGTPENKATLGALAK